MKVNSRLRLLHLVRKSGRLFGMYRCKCGNHKVIYVHSVKSGATRSCGCLNRELLSKRGWIHQTHGEGGNGKETPEYHAWIAMKQRCYFAQHKTNKRNYQDRGIQVCKEWRDNFPAFLESVGRKPGPEYSLDRINNDGNYEPGNCRWATKKEQAANRRKP